MAAETPEARFAELVATDASRPFVTYYDEATGERSELSRKSLANWVAKTRYLLTDELGLGVGDTAVLALPAHWISVPIVLGACAAGLALTDAGAADVAFGSPASFDDLDAGDVYLIDPDRAAVGFGDDVPDGANDFVAAVRPQADTWAGMTLPAAGDDPLLPGATRADTLRRASGRAAELGLDDGGRLLSAAAWNGPDDWLDTVFAPLVVGGSVVFVRNASGDVVARRVDQERATVTVGQ